MKTMTKAGVFVRVSDEEARKLVKMGWKYCPKSEWKLNVRDKK